MCQNCAKESVGVYLTTIKDARGMTDDERGRYLAMIKDEVDPARIMPNIGMLLGAYAALVVASIPPVVAEKQPSWWRRFLLRVTRKREPLPRVYTIR